MYRADWYWMMVQVHPVLMVSVSGAQEAERMHTQSPSPMPGGSTLWQANLLTYKRRPQMSHLACGCVAQLRHKRAHSRTCLHCLRVVVWECCIPHFNWCNVHVPRVEGLLRCLTWAASAGAASRPSPGPASEQGVARGSKTPEPKQAAKQAKRAAAPKNSRQPKKQRTEQTPEPRCSTPASRL